MSEEANWSGSTLSEIRAWASIHSDQYLLFTFLQYSKMDRIKRKKGFEHVQNAQIQIILCMCKVSSGPLLSIHTFCSI